MESLISQPFLPGKAQDAAVPRAGAVTVLRPGRPLLSAPATFTLVHTRNH